jgi:hypothetical protein
MHSSRSHDAVIRVYDDASNVIAFAVNSSVRDPVQSRDCSYAATITALISRRQL